MAGPRRAARRPAPCAPSASPTSRRRTSTGSSPRRASIPDVNQVQLNPRHAQRDTRAYDEAHGIVTQSWSPIGQGNDLLADPVVVAVAGRLGCAPAQAVLAWHLAHGLAVVPKSSDPARLRQNLASALVPLDEAARESLDTLDGLEASVTDPDVFGH